MIIFAALGFLRNFAFLSQQNNIVFFILLVHYQQLSMQLVSAFRGRRGRLCSNRAHFQSHGFEIGIT